MPWPSPKEAKGLWAAAIFPQPPPTYRNLPGLGLPPRVLTLGSHRRLGEGQGSYISCGCPGELPEGWGGRMSQVGKKEGFLQALTSASLLSPWLRPERNDLLSEQPLPPPPPPADTNIDN